MTKGSEMLAETRGKVDDERVIRTAAEAFIRFGFAGMSMRDLAKKCGSTYSLLYYRFGSKEELYSEACQYEINTFFAAVTAELKKQRHQKQGAEALAEAFFDAWLDNPNALLLTSSDVINARASPERMQICDHYPTMIKLVRGLCSEQLSVEVSDDFCFAYTAIVFGMCSLTLIDRHYRDVKGIAFDNDIYIQHRKQMLLNLCASIKVT